MTTKMTQEIIQVQEEKETSSKFPTLKVHPDVHIQIKKQAVEEGLSILDFTEKLFSEYMKTRKEAA